MRPRLPPALVRRSLDAHSAIGLVIGALMYFVCLTGAVAVLSESLERWEQPGIEEFHEVTPQAVRAAFDGFLARVDEPPPALWVYFPTAAVPRMTVFSEDEEWLVDSSGSLVDTPSHGYTHMVQDLHLRLHLPVLVGLPLVSALGVMLLALIVSGLLAHPTLFRDAFHFRRLHRRLQQVDLHNRLSVWGLPFHLMIGLTGAFFGLIGILAISASTLIYQASPESVYDEIYGGDPDVDAEVEPLQLETAMQTLATEVPEASPIYLVAHKMGTRAQFVEIGATLPGRLSWSEIYRFDAAGRWMGSQELASGPAGRQWLYSIYRIHFGWFGGQLTRIVWLILGLALTVVSVTGVEIWLIRRGREDRVARAWTGVVWGTPLALALSAFGSVLLPLAPLPVFLMALFGAIGLATVGEDRRRSARLLQVGCASTCLTLAVGHALVFAPARAGAAAAFINAWLLFAAACLFLLARRQESSASVGETAAPQQLSS